MIPQFNYTIPESHCSYEWRLCPSLGPLTERWSVPGGRVILPCDVTPPFHEDAPILVLISKGDTPVYRWAH